MPISVLPPLAVLLLAASPVLAQAFGPGPMGTVPGSSMAGAPIGGSPRLRPRNQIPNAPVFGDTVEERAYGREFDDSYLRPVVPRPDLGGDETAIRATRGRSTVEQDNAGAFARSDPSAINQSGVTRPIAPPRRARIVPNKAPPEPR